MRRIALLLVVAVVALIGGVVGLAAWLVYTPEGLRWAAEQAARFTDDALRFQQPAGTLARGAMFSALHYDTPTMTVHGRDVRLNVSLASLLRLAPRISEVSVGTLRIETRPGQDEPDKPLEVPALPVALEIDAARVARLELQRDDETLLVEDLFLRYGAQATRHRLDDVKLRMEGFAIAMTGTLGTAAPYSVNARATVMRPTGAPSLNAQIEAEGSLERLTLQISAESAGARVQATAEVMPAAVLPLTRLDAAFAALNLRAFDARLPHTALSGSARLSEAAGALTGPIAIDNALSGSYNEERIPVTQLRTDVRADLSEAALRNLVIELSGSGALSGSASLKPDSAALSLTARAVDLKALHGRLHATQLAGTLEAQLLTDRQSVNADLTQQGMRLQLRAGRAGDAVTLHEGILHAKGGEASARGTLTLAADQPFEVQVLLKRFDPAAWGDFPQGSINAKFAGRGSLDEPSARVAFEIADSRLRDAPLAGGGRFSIAGSRLAAADFNVRLGSNRADAKGAYGRPNDTLRIRIDAPRLALLDPDLNGQIRGEAQLSGTFSAPVVRFDFNATGASALGVAVERATARGVFAQNATAPLRLDARIFDLSAAGWLVKRMDVDLDGSQRAHTAAIKATGAGFDVLMRARGGWNAATTTWSGTLLEFANRGALDAALEKPVALTAAPERIAVGSFTMRLLDGRLEADEVRYQEGRLTTAGRFARLPVGDLAAALRLRPPVGGNLRVSGAWSFVQEGTLTGSLNVTRDSGDITIGKNGTLPMQLQALSIAARADRAQIHLQASVRSALASAEASGTIGVLRTDAGSRITSASPLKISGKLAVSELAAVARFVDANMLVDGAVSATMTATGTLGKPVFNGEIAGERLAFALPPQGVDLRGGTLRAVVNDRAIRVESFSIRGGDGTFSARGSLAFNGAGATLDWQAERLLLLARPDRRLVVSGQGRAGLIDGNLSLSGGVRVNQGYFEIGEDALPEPGRDVIVLGDKPRAKDESRLAGMQLEVVVNFGDDFRVRGRGLDTRLTGEIVVATKPGQALRAKGAVRTVRGIYTALGQRLEIERGELLFSGPIDNPGLDIRAMRKRQAVEAGVEVTGTLNTPLVRVVSEPPVAESEAISWLLLGHGTGDASRGDLAMLPLAASALLRKGDSPTVAQRLGLDTLGVRGAGGANQFLTVGKRIADRLYVAFEQSLGAAASILKLEFDLTDRVLLRAQTGEANSVGVFYRYTFD
ncbi:MAG: translocation/assembly module TamB domain-containing protein [Betaproteobacteria bacterium]